MGGVTGAQNEKVCVAMVASSLPRRRIRLDDPDDDLQPDSEHRAANGNGSGDTLNGELLIGCHAIAQFVFGSTVWANRKRIYYWIKTGEIPAGKLGGKVFTTKQKIREHLDALIDEH
jgi:hypothetical protein